MKNSFPKLEYILPLIERSDEKEKTRLLIVSKKDCLGKINNVLKTVLEKGFEIESLNMHLRDTGSGQAYFWDIIVSNPNRSEGPRTIDELLAREKDEIDSYIVIPGDKGYLFNQFITGLKTGNGERAVIWGEPNIRGVFVNLRKDYGELGKLILGKLGEYVGKELAKKYKETGVEGVEKALLMLLHGGVSKGAYSLREYRVTRMPGKSLLIKIVMDRHLEEEFLRKEGIKDCSSYQKGVFKGFLEEVLGSKSYKLTIEQSKCIGRGEDYSVFHLTISPQR